MLRGHQGDGQGQHSDASQVENATQLRGNLLQRRRFAGSLVLSLSGLRDRRRRKQARHNDNAP